MSWFLLLIQLIPVVIIGALFVYTLSLVIRVCKIYIEKNK